MMRTFLRLERRLTKPRELFLPKKKYQADKIGMAGGNRPIGHESKNDAYKMWFMLIGKEKHGIGYATSSDGIWWSPYPENPVFAVGLLDEWDGEELGTAEVLKENDTYVMWYREIAENYNK